MNLNNIDIRYNKKICLEKDDNNRFICNKSIMEGEDLCYHHWKLQQSDCEVLSTAVPVVKKTIKKEKRNIHDKMNKLKNNIIHDYSLYSSIVQKIKNAKNKYIDEEVQMNLKNKNNDGVRKYNSDSFESKQKRIFSNYIAETQCEGINKLHESDDEFDREGIPYNLYEYINGYSKKERWRYNNIYEHEKYYYIKEQQIRKKLYNFLKEKNPYRKIKIHEIDNLYEKVKCHKDYNNI